MSASLIFADMAVPGARIPLFESKTSGIIFRPGVTKVLCGKSADSAGTCHGPYQSWCPKSSTHLERPWAEGTDKLCSWHPNDFGVQLQRLTRHQQATGDLFYNVSAQKPCAQARASSPALVRHVCVCVCVCLSCP